MNYGDAASLPIKLSEFELEDKLIKKLHVVKWQNLGGTYQGWVLDCNCENEEGRTRVFALLEGDVVFSVEDVKSWFQTLEPESKKARLIQHKAKQYDIAQISPKMRDPYFFAELEY